MTEFDGIAAEVDSDAHVRAAINWAGLEVVDLTRLSGSGGGYMNPGDTGPYLNGRIGWPFMSWVLRSWVRAGLVDVYADAAMEADDELRDFGWLERAVPDRRWLNLLPADAEALVSDYSLWGLGHAVGQFELVLSEKGTTADPDEFIRIALASDEPRPALGEHPGQRELVELGNAEANWEGLSVRWEFPVSGATAEQPGRVVWEPRLYIVRRRGSNGDAWARVLAESEDEIRSVAGEVDMWLEKDALTDTAINYEVEQLRKLMPTDFDKGINFRRVN